MPKELTGYVVLLDKLTPFSLMGGPTKGPLLSTFMPNIHFITSERSERSSY